MKDIPTHRWKNMRWDWCDVLQMEHFIMHIEQSVLCHLSVKNQHWFSARVKYKCDRQCQKILSFMLQYESYRYVCLNHKIHAQPWVVEYSHNKQYQHASDKTRHDHFARTCTLVIVTMTLFIFYYCIAIYFCSFFIVTMGPFIGYDIDSILMLCVRFKQIYMQSYKNKKKKIE